MIFKIRSTFAALIAVLIMIGASATKLQFNVVLTDEELIAARVPQALNSGIKFQWTKSKVDLQFKSGSGTLNSACTGTVCELQTNASDLFRSKTIGEIQSLLRNFTFSWDAPSTEQYQLLLLLVWHEANIVDGVDYARPITLYAKQISVGLPIGQLSESQDTQQEALRLLNKDGVTKLSTEAQICRLQLLDKAQYDPQIVVSARNGTCTWTTDYAGPATLNDKNSLIANVVIETTFYDVTLCEAAEVVGFQHDVDALEVVFKSTQRSGFCVDQVLKNDEFPQLWHKKPTTEHCVPLQGGLQKCRYSFEHTTDSDYGYRTGGKTLVEVNSAKQPSLISTSITFDHAYSEVELIHDDDTWRVDFCVAFDIQDPMSPQQLQIKSQSGTKVTCDLSAFKRVHKQDQLAIKLKGGIKETLPVLVQFIQPPEHTSKHIVVVTEDSDFQPKFILIHQPLLTMTGPCVFIALPTGTIKLDFLARAIRVSENAFQCEITPEIVAAGRTKFAIKLANANLKAEIRFIKKAYVHFVQAERQIRVLREDFFDSALAADDLFLQDTETSELFEVLRSDSESLSFDVCGRTVQLVAVVNGQILSLSINEFAAQTCQNALDDGQPQPFVATELPVAYQFDEFISMVLTQDSAQAPVAISVGVHDQTILHADHPRLSEITLLEVDLASTQMAYIHAQGCLTALEVSEASRALLINYTTEQNALCRMESSKNGKVIHRSESRYNAAAGICDTLCYSLISPGTKTMLTIVSTHAATKPIALTVVSKLILAKISPDNVILFADQIEDITFILTGTFPHVTDQSEFGLEIKGGHASRFLKINRINDSYEVVVSSNSLMPGLMEVAVTFNNQRSNSLEVYIQSPVRIEHINTTVLLNGEHLAPLEFLKLSQGIVSFSCIYSSSTSQHEISAESKQGVYSCQQPWLEGRWEVSVQSEGKRQRYHFATVIALQVAVEDVQPDLVLFANETFTLELTDDLPDDSEVFCSFQNEPAQTKLSLKGECAVPQTSVHGKKRLQLITKDSVLTLAHEVTLADFSQPRKIEAVPAILEAGRKDLILTLEFDSAIPGTLLIQHRDSFHELIQSGPTNYIFKVPRLEEEEIGQITFHFFISSFSNSTGIRPTGISITLQVVQPLPDFQSVELTFYQSAARVIVQLIPYELDANGMELRCLYDEGITSGKARIINQMLVCEDFLPAVFGRHQLDVFSYALNRFIHRSSHIVVVPSPQITSLTQRVLFDQTGVVLNPVFVHMDSALVNADTCQLALTSIHTASGQDRFKCPCTVDYHEVRCTCDKAPRMNDYQVSLELARPVTQTLSLSQTVFFMQMPGIKSVSPRVLKPTESPQFMVVTLKEKHNGIRLVTGIVWNHGEIESQEFSWVAADKLKVAVPLTFNKSGKLSLQLVVSEGFISESFSLQVSKSFVIEAFNVGIVSDFTCVLIGTCTFTFGPEEAQQLLLKDSHDNTVISVEGVGFERTTPYICVLESRTTSVIITQVFLLSPSHLVCVVPKNAIDELPAATELKVGLGVFETDFIVYFDRAALFIAVRPMLANISPKFIYGTLLDGNQITTRPQELTLTGNWTPIVSTVIVKVQTPLQAYYFEGHVDENHPANVLRVQFTKMVIPYPLRLTVMQHDTQFKQQVCLQISVDQGRTFTDAQDPANSPCKLTLIPEPIILEQSFDFQEGNRMKLKAVLQHVHANADFVWRHLNSEDYLPLRVNQLSRTDPINYVWQLDFEVSVDDTAAGPIEIFVATIEKVYIVFPLRILRLATNHSQAPIYRHMLLPLNDISTNEFQLDLPDFHGSAALTANPKLVAVASNFATKVRIEVFNSRSQIGRLTSRLNESFDLVFQADNVKFQLTHNFITVDQGDKAYIEIEVHPDIKAASTLVNLRMQIVTDSRNLTPLYDTGIVLDFRSALTLARVPSYVIIAAHHVADRFYEIQLEGTGLQLLSQNAATCRSDHADGVVIEREGKFFCVIRIRELLNMEFTVVSEHIVRGQSALVAEALPRYSVVIMPDIPLITAITKTQSVDGSVTLVLQGDNFLTEASSLVECSFYGYSNLEKVWHLLRTVPGLLQIGQVECQLPDAVASVCMDLSASVSFTLRQGKISSHRHNLPLALETGPAFQALRVKSLQPRTIRGDFKAGTNVTELVGHLEVTMDESACFFAQAARINCIYSTNTQQETQGYAQLRWPIVLCPIIYTGAKEIDLALQIEDFKSTRSTIIKNAIRFDQGSLKVLTVAPQIKLGIKETAIIFQLSSPYQNIKCIFDDKTGSLLTRDVTVNKRIIQCLSPITQADELEVWLLADGEPIPFFDHHNYSVKIPVIHFDTTQRSTELFFNSNKVLKLAGDLSLFEFCVFKAPDGTNLLMTELSFVDISSSTCPLPASLVQQPISRQSKRILKVSLQLQGSEETTSEWQVTLYPELSITHAYFEAETQLIFALDRSKFILDSVSCQYGTFTVAAVYRPDEELYGCAVTRPITEFTVSYKLFDEVKFHQTPSYAVPTIDRQFGTFTFVKSTQGFLLLKALKTSVRPAVCLFKANGRSVYSELENSGQGIWLSQNYYVCQQLSEQASLLDSQTAIELLSLSSPMTTSQLVEEHQRQVLMPGNLKIFIRTKSELGRYCSLRTCLDQNSYGIVHRLDLTTVMCEMNWNHTIDLSENLFVSDDLVFWHEIKVPVQVREDPIAIYEQWPTVIPSDTTQHTITLYGSNFVADAQLIVDGRQTKFNLVSARELIVVIDIDAQLYGVDEQSCIKLNTTDCRGPQFSLPLVIFRQNPVSNETINLLSSTITLQKQLTVVFQDPSFEVTGLHVPPFDVEPKVILCNTRTTLKLTFSSKLISTSKDLKLRSLPLQFEDDQHATVPFYENCKSANLTSVQIKLGSQQRTILATQKFELKKRGVDRFSAVENELFRVLVLALNQRLTCRLNELTGIVQMTEIADEYECSLIAPLSQPLPEDNLTLLTIFVESLEVGSLQDTQRALAQRQMIDAFNDAHIVLDKTEFQNGKDQSLRLTLLLRQEVLSQQYAFTCSYGTTAYAATIVSSSVLDCPLPQVQSTEFITFQIVAENFEISRAIAFMPIVIRPAFEIMSHKTLLMEGDPIELTITEKTFDDELICFARQGEERLKRAPTHLKGSILSCSLDLHPGFSSIYLGIKGHGTTQVSRNSVIIQSIKRPKLSSVWPTEIWVEPGTKQNVQIALEGQFDLLSAVDARLSIRSSAVTWWTTTDVTQHFMSASSSILVTVDDIRQIPVGAHYLTMEAQHPDLMELELLRTEIKLSQAVLFDVQPYLIFGGTSAPVKLTFSIQSKSFEPSHCRLSSPSFSIVLPISECSISPPYTQVALGRFITPQIEQKFVQMTTQRLIIYKPDLILTSAEMYRDTLVLHGTGFMEAFGIEPVWCKVIAKVQNDQDQANRVSKLVQEALIVDNQRVWCSAPAKTGRYYVQLQSIGSVYLVSNRVEFSYFKTPIASVMAMSYDVWVKEEDELIRINTAQSAVAKQQRNTSNSGELKVMVESHVVFFLKMESIIITNVECQLRRKGTLEALRIASSIQQWEETLRCPSVTIGPDVAFFAGSDSYQLMVSFDGEDFQTIEGLMELRITIEQPIAYRPMPTVSDIFKAIPVIDEPCFLKNLNCTEEPVSSHLLVQTNCQNFNPPMLIPQESEWVYYPLDQITNNPVLVLDQPTRPRLAPQLIFTSICSSPRIPTSPMTIAAPQTLTLQPSNSNQGYKQTLNIFSAGYDSLCQLVYQIPDTIEFVKLKKYADFHHGVRAVPTVRESYYRSASFAFFTLPPTSVGCEVESDISRNQITFKFNIRRPFYIEHSLLEPKYIIEDRIILSDQAVQASTQTITITGVNLTPDLTCIIAKDEIEYSLSVIFISATMVSCDLGTVFPPLFEDRTTYVKVTLQNESGDRALLYDISTDTATDSALELQFIPRLTISFQNFTRPLYYYYANLDQRINLSLSYSPQSAECEFKSTFYTTRTSFDSSSSACPVPNLSDDDTPLIELSIRQKYSANQYAYSNKLIVPLMHLPSVISVTPLEVPAETDYYQQVVDVQGTAFVQDVTYLVLRPLDSSDHYVARSPDFERYEQTQADYMPRDASQWITILDFRVISSTNGQFIAPSNMKRGLYSVAAATQDSKTLSDSQVALHFIKLPEIERLLPPEVPQIAVKDVLGSSNGHRIVLEGKYFSQYSRCVVQSFIVDPLSLDPVPVDTLVTTTWVSPSYLECIVNPQQFAPFSYSGNSVKLRVLERSLYLNVETYFDLKFTNQPYVWKLEPNQAYLSNPGTLIKVYVSNQSIDPINDLENEFLFCQFGGKDIAKVIKVETLPQPTDLCLDNILYDTGVSEHTQVADQCRTTATVFHCKTPGVQGKSAYTTSVEILNSEGQMTHTVLGLNQFSFVDTPVILAVWPHVLPVVDVTLQPPQSLDQIVITGINFVPNASYQCVFKRSKASFNLEYLSVAEVGDTNTLSCNIPYINDLPIGVAAAEFVTVKVQLLLEGGQVLRLKGTSKIKLYKQPIILDYWPKIGKESGGTSVTIKGNHLYADLGGVMCRFGSSEVKANVLTKEQMVKCVVPAGTGKVTLGVSVDGGKKYFSAFRVDTRVVSAEYVYVPDIIAVTSVDNETQFYWGTESIVTYTQLPYTELASVATKFGHAQVDVRCRLVFSDGDELFTAGTVSDTGSEIAVVCPSRRHLTQDNSIVLSITFNNQEYHELSTNAVFNVVPFTYETIPLYSVATTADLYDFIVKLQYSEAICPDIYKLPSQAFHADMPPIWDNKLDVNILVAQEVTDIPCLSISEFFYKLVSTPMSTDTQQTTYEYRVGQLTFKFYSNPNVDFAWQVQQLYLLYSWLCTQSSAVLRCSGRQKEFMVSIQPYFDPLAVSSTQDTRLSCKAGSFIFNDVIEEGQIMLVECMVDLSRYSYQVPTIYSEIDMELHWLLPRFGYITESNIELQIYVTPLLPVEGLVCKLNDVVIKGKYALFEDVAIIACSIPSMSYLRQKTKLPLPLLNTWMVKVSMDGYNYSKNELAFKFLEPEQIFQQFPYFGPETGGTVITHTVNDLPPIDMTVLPVTLCRFPGHEEDPAYDVLGIFVGLNTITCTTPPLKVTQAGIDAGLIADFPQFATVRVNLIVLGYGNCGNYTFSYMKDVRITHFDPPNYVFDSSVNAQGLTEFVPVSRKVKIIGQHFLPADEWLYCRVGFPNPVEILATYLFNNTIECLIPPPPDGTNLPLVVPIEVSFNKGQQYTNLNVMFHYTPQEFVTKIYPQRQFVKGNEIVKFFTTYFFDKLAPTASCLFTYQPNPADPLTKIDYRVKIIQVDDEGVACYHPPAYLISNQLAEEGGDTIVTISSNGVDYSTNTMKVFTYKKQVVIDDVFPPFILMDQNIVVTLTGKNFYGVADTQLLKVRLTRIVTDPLMTSLFTIVEPPFTSFVSATIVTFVFPSGVFADKDLVSVELTFDEVTWDMAESQHLLVYKQVVLTKIRPSYIYTNYFQTEILADNQQNYVSKYEVILQAETYFDQFNQLQQSGTIIEMEQFNYMQCRFVSALNDIAEQSVNGYFLNQTHIGCPFPGYAKPELIMVDLTIDKGVTYSANKIGVYVIDEPIILALNNTEYYWTFNEQVYIELTGVNLDKSGFLYVRVGDQVQSIPMVKGSGANRIVFYMPIELDLGPYLIAVSTDGVTYRPDPAGAGPLFTVTISKCPNGFICSQEVPVICPQGYFCPHDELQVHQKRECRLGTLMTGEGAHECNPCGVGKYCPDIRLYVEQNCPMGFVCDAPSRYSVANIKECPAGYICKTDFTNAFDSNDLFAAKNMKPCPNGFFCPKGSQDYVMTTAYGNFTTPQVCNQGYLCAQNHQEKLTSNQIGAVTQFGIDECPAGYFCQKGRRNPCPPGFKCPNRGEYAPEPCQPGYFQSNTTQTKCDQCPIGTFCFFAKMSLPIQCRPGWVCQMKAGMSPAQLCPAGSFCNIAVVTNLTNSTTEELYRPNNCYSSSYCLAGVYTPFVDSNNQQAAQSCLAGTFCEEGSASPEGKGKCKEGFYCPPSSIQMIPTEPGYFAQGTGNVMPEKCRPGYYQDKPQQADCIPCPIGHFCPNQQMTAPYICLEGEFQPVEGQTQCAKCPLGTYSDQIGVTSEESCFQCEARFMCSQTGLTTMTYAQACQEGFYCMYGTTNTIMLSQKVFPGYYGQYNITGLAEFNLCIEGKYCSAGTASSKVKQLDCLKGYFCPIGTMADLDINGNFQPGVKQVNRWVLINALKDYLSESIKYTNKFALNITENNLVNQLNFYSSNQDKHFAAYNRLRFEFYKYNLNLTIIEERTRYLNDVLLKDVRCVEDKTLPEQLIQAYIQNGTNLVCPKGTESDRAAWCLGQCKINLASKIPMSILNPVKDIVGISSLSAVDSGQSLRADTLGSQFLRENPDYVEGQAKDKGSVGEKSPWAKGTQDLIQDRKLASDDHITSDKHRIRRIQEIEEHGRYTRRKLQLNAQKRNFDIVGGGIFDTVHVQTLKPLEIARLNFNLTVLPDKFQYNDHFEIKILDENDIPFKLPVYFSVDNNLVTNKRAFLQIRIFNWTENDQIFKVALYLYHALFIPYLEILSDKMWIELYNAERQTRGTNMTHGVIITESQMDGVTLPYNTPDFGNDPKLWLDFVSTNQPNPDGSSIQSEFRVNPTTKALDKDVFDPTYWQSKQISAVIMPWLPFFSNCDGFDSRIIIYDAFEYARNCTLENYDDIKIVNPIPTKGLNPQADHCSLDITCRYDEPLDSDSITTRWFQIREEKTLGYITRDPIPIENFWKIEDSDVYQTFYNSLIEDGSDDIVFIQFVPGDTSGERIPRLVEVEFLYYQKTIDVKVVQSVRVYLKEYDEPLEPGQKAEVGYRLKINYKPLNFFNLINTFQFAFPIYILLFNLVALVLIMSVLTFWFIVMLFQRNKRPPALRFEHIAKVIFTPPAIGTLLACVPVFIAAIVVVAYTRSSLFHGVNSNWIDWGSDASLRDIVRQQRGRAGLMLVMNGFIFLHYGSNSIIYKPSEEEEEEIHEHQHKLRKLERQDLSIDEKNEAIEADNAKEAKEENHRIRDALEWKRKHFFVTYIAVICWMLLKIEFSYTQIFTNNIQAVLIIFMMFDIILEQILVRSILQEALLVAPLLGSFTIVEFIMTMGANDLKAFIFSYFISFTVTMTDRIFLAPFVEKIEAWTQRLFIFLAQKSRFFNWLFRNILIKQLAAQLQLMSLNEFNDRRIRREDNEEIQKKRHLFDWQLEKGEGAEALLGSMMTYTTQTQALFLIPEALLLIIYLANETKIPQKYTIRKSDLTYYFIFTVCNIIPTLIVDIFILHVIEVIQGYKLYDYFTYCDYRYSVRKKRWLEGKRLDKSLNHHMRSLDGLLFSSQYYYIINICTWSIIFLYLGITAINRNSYNPFADPILIPVFAIFPLFAIPIKWILAFMSEKIGVWAPNRDPSQEIEASLMNRLDVAYNQRRIINNIQTNPFRHRFITVNREWIVSNIADVLGGRAYLAEAGSELDYLKQIYQTAVNTQKLTKQIEAQQKALAKKLEMLPYNNMNDRANVSEDRVSDEPVNDWQLPESLAKPHVFRLSRMWLDYARQTIRLKFMVADIVQSKLRNRCQKCKERFRLQVIQKFNFTNLTRKFAQANVGIPFNQPRWRRFFARNQQFTTLCMECAYIDNLQAGAIREENPKLQEFLQEHAYRLLGQNEELVRRKIKLPHVKRIIYKWIQEAKASILHRALKRKRQKRSKSLEKSKSDSTLDFF